MSSPISASSRTLLGLIFCLIPKYFTTPSIRWMVRQLEKKAPVRK
ncbi:MAG: hypothetical protein ACXQS7_04425 [Candidatus Syntropharchaeia archaeon]